MDDRINDYITQLYAQEDEILRWIRAETERHHLPKIHLQPYEGRLLQLLMHMSNTRKAVEIGTLAGYSAVWMARALPTNGKLYTCEVNPETATIARASFARAAVEDKIDIVVGNALDTLHQLAPFGPFDFVFIDADKEGYTHYLTWAVNNLRVGGVVAAHNALRRGEVVNPTTTDAQAIDAFNRTLASYPNLESLIFAIGDGMAVAVKRV